MLWKRALKGGLTRLWVAKRFCSKPDHIMFLASNVCDAFWLKVRRTKGWKGCWRIKASLGSQPWKSKMWYLNVPPLHNFKSMHYISSLVNWLPTVRITPSPLIGQIDIIFVGKALWWLMPERLSSQIDLGVSTQANLPVQNLANWAQIICKCSHISKNCWLWDNAAFYTPVLRYVTFATHLRYWPVHINLHVGYSPKHPHNSEIKHDLQLPEW